MTQNGVVTLEKYCRQFLSLLLVTPETIIKNGYSLSVDIYSAHKKRHNEDIDVEAVQQALLKQQRNTNLIIRKLSAFTNG